MRMKRRLIALLLSIIMIISVIPISSIAAYSERVEETKNEEIVQKSIDETYEELEEPGEIIESFEDSSGDVIGEVIEDVSLREENVKHFLLSNGTCEAVAYMHPVHRKDENGIWQDIDNSLSLEENGKSRNYSTADSRIRFAGALESDTEIYKLSENGYSISMTLVQNNNEKTDVAIEPTVKNHKKRANRTMFDSLDEAKKINNKSTIVYNDIQANTSIEYILYGNDVKENIIINAPCEKYEYQFQMNLEGLYAELDEMGRIILFDKQDGQTKYIIPAPYMYDDKDERSNDVCYDLKFQKNGEYLLKITADASWINSEDRAYPIKIDPTVTTDYFIFDSYTSSASPNTNYGRADKLWISTTADTYIYMSIPELPEGSIINNAYLNIAYYFNVSTGSLMACAYRITGSWDEYTITYNNAPSYSRTAPGTNYFYASSSINSTSPGRAYFTITNAVRNWYNNGSTSGYQSGTNFGIVLKRISNSNHTNSSVILISYEGDYDNCANISINYFPKAPISDGIYQIKSAYSGYYMQVYGKGTSVGTTIQQNVNMYEDHQQFLIKSEDNGEYTIRPIHALDKALSVADMHTGTVATLANYNPNSTNQRFKISLTDNGKYVISTRISDYEKALVVTNGSDLAGQTISQCEYNSSTQWHNWILEFAGPESGVFSFKSYNSLYYMVSYSHTHGEFVPKSFFEDSPTLSNDSKAFFKLIYRPSSQDYVIRNMVDNSVVIYPGSIRPYSTDEICADINDADVSANYTWRISKAGTNSYYIWYQQSDSSPKKYLNISSVDDYLTLTETRVLATRWVLNRSYESMRKIEYNNTLSHIIESGDSIDLNDYFENCTYLSTYIGDNEPGGAVSYSVSDI